MLFVCILPSFKSQKYQEKISLSSLRQTRITDVIWPNKTFEFHSQIRLTFDLTEQEKFKLRVWYLLKIEKMLSVNDKPEALFWNPFFAFISNSVRYVNNT